MSSIAIDMEVRNYMQAVAAELADLPDEERADLMADLESHLHEVASDGEGTLFERLGAASAYAAELRSSAGLPPKGETADRVGLTSRVASSWHGWHEWYAASPASRFFTNIAPGWWLVRAYLLVVAVDRLFFWQPVQHSPMPIPSFAGSPGMGIIAVLMAGVASYVIGSRAREGSFGRLNMLVTVGAVVLGGYAVGDIAGSQVPPQAAYSEVQVLPELHHEDGTPISNICAYDSKLRPLKNVLLYDQAGRPIDNIAAPPYWTGDSVYGPDAGRFRNLYPLKQQIQNPETAETKSFKCPTLKD
jgi:hypothetical protein